MSYNIDWIKNINLDRKNFENDADYDYLVLGKKLIETGVYREGRNGGTLSIFGTQLRFDLSKGFPLLTTKKIVVRSIIHELIWFLKGDTSAQYLIDNNVKIWDLWINENNDLPNTYPKQWRRFSNKNGEPIDQVANALDQIKNNPTSRRIIINAWNPAEIETAALPPCHAFIQFYVADGKLSCHLLQRSLDFFLGGGFNIPSYAMLLHLFAHLTNLEVGEFIWTSGDCHVYTNQLDSVKEQFFRKSHKLPELRINPDLKNINDVKFEDFEIVGYKSEAFIKIPVSE